MSDKINILIIHGKIRLGAKLSNMRALRRYINEVFSDIDKTIDLIVLPPFPFTGPVIGYYTGEKRIRDHLRAAAEILSRKMLSSRVLEFLMKLARDYDVSIITGPMIERAGPRLYITSLHIDRYGDLVGKYRKIAVTKTEEAYGINPGKEPGIFVIGTSRARIGVFIDEDLAYGEIFRYMQANDANIIIGFMLPYVSDYFKLVTDENHMMTMEEDPIREFLGVRSRETGLPIVLVGGTVESNANPYYAYTRTLPVEPDIGLIETAARGPRDGMSTITMEVNTRTSKPRPLNRRTADLCKRLFQARKI